MAGGGGGRVSQYKQVDYTPDKTVEQPRPNFSAPRSCRVGGRRRRGFPDGSRPHTVGSVHAADDPVLWLVAVLRRGGSEVIAGLLRRVPVFADVVSGRGPFAMRQGWGVARPGPRPLSDVSELAEYLARGAGVRLRLLHANRNERQLLVMTRSRVGSSTNPGPASCWASPTTVGQGRLDRASTGLNDLLLTDPAAGWVVLAPGITDWISLPGVTFRAGSEGITHDELAARLRRMQLGAAGTRKFENLRPAIEAGLRDPDTVKGILRRLDPSCRELLAGMVGRGVQPVEVTGSRHYHTHSTYGRRAEVPASPLHQLVQHGLVGVQEYGQLCWVWLDVELSTPGGVLYHDWMEPTPRPQEINATDTITIPPTINALDAVSGRVFDNAGQSAQDGLTRSAVGSAMAKTRRRTTVEVGLPRAWRSNSDSSVLSCSTSVAGAATTVSSTAGARTRSVSHRGARSPTWARWARLVQQWLDSIQLPVDGATIERYEPGSRYALATLVRCRFVEILAALPAGRGFESAALQEVLAFHHPYSLGVEAVAQIVAEARGTRPCPAGRCARAHCHGPPNPRRLAGAR